MTIKVDRLVDKVVTRFVPSFNQIRFIMHVGHLVTLFCNLLYAKKHGGHSYVLPIIKYIGPGLDKIQDAQEYAANCYGTQGFEMLGIAEEDIMFIPLFIGGWVFRQDLINKVKEATGLEDKDIIEGWQREALVVAMTDFVVGTNVIIRGRDLLPDTADASVLEYLDDHLALFRRFKKEAGQDDEIREYFAPLVTREGEKISQASIHAEDSAVIFRKSGGIPGISYLAWMMEVLGSPAESLDDILNYHEVFDIEKVPDEISFVPDELEVVSKRVRSWMPDEAFLEDSDPSKSQRYEARKIQVKLFREALGITSEYE